MRLRGFIYAQLALVLLLVVSCVTEYQPGNVSIPPALIVEGLITDQPGPYLVKLTRTADYSYKSLNLLETGATVIISDDLGNQEVLTEQSPGGTYKTAKLQGIAGRTYKLTIRARNGEQYESEPEQLKASPPIGRLYYEYRYDAGASTNGKANGWDVYVDSKDPETPGDFYRWEWAHYEFTKACTRVYISGAPGHYEGIPCCSDCWDITRCYINCINIMSDVTINGNSISRQFIERVLYDASTRYYLEVTQQRLSKGVYEFFKTAKQQVLNTGGLFDSAPGSIAGNMHSVTNPTMAVYGYFGAVGESVSYVLIDRSDAIGPPDYTEPLYPASELATCVVCENSQYRTPIKPRWW
ncbi:DUF4249 family protein [Spirosoma sp. HMF4905]|uniref:DUF4249 family protein n=1 Tax=Spirosoma arboris TaxID=2682092 RepID=A0A7K1S9C1_9BACT|nr:DUF4249 domain-containing protein [Spirosoma arboris]MVM30258.1 DUF4249 family protein [Spirosoma arboris]